MADRVESTESAVRAVERVLVVEDDAAIADAVLYALRRDGFEAHHAATLAQARSAAAANMDLVILDLGLPDGSGFSILDEMRHGPRIIVLTSRDEDVDCVAALEAGADDFVAKPFSPRVLVARVRAVLRRGARGESAAPGAVYGDGAVRGSAGLCVDVERRLATYANKPLTLTKIEFDLLTVLEEAPGRVRTRAYLVSRVWGEMHALTERTVDSHFKGLRKKLEEAGAPATLIETVRGVGFKLQEDP